MNTISPLSLLSVSGHLGCFRVLVIVNSAAMNIEGAGILSDHGFHFGLSLEAVGLYCLLAG